MIYLQSAFCKAAGYALICNIIQAALLWLIVYLLNKFIYRNPRKRFVTAFAAQVFCLILFLFTFNYFLHSDKATLYNAAVLPLGELKNFSDNRLMPLLAQLYFLAAAYQLLKYIADVISVGRLGSEAINSSAGSWQQFIRVRANELRIKKIVRLQISDTVQTPSVTGFLKPVILMPLSALNNLSSFEMEAVLMHELVHIQRGDFLLHLVQLFIQRILWFNPFVLMLFKITETERENCCDDIVLSYNYNKLQYAEALYKLAVNKAAVTAAVHFAGKNDMQLLTRIQRIIFQKKKVAYSPVSMFSVALFVCAFSIFALMFLSLPVHNSFSYRQKIFSREEVVLPAVPTISVISKSAIVKIAADEMKKNVTVKPAAANKKSEVQHANTPAVAANENIISLPDVQPLLVSADSMLMINYFSTAKNTSINLTETQYQKVLSYNTFKTIESMLEVSGDSCISVKEGNLTKNNYRKQVTINTVSKNGDEHTYTVIVEMYQ